MVATATVCFFCWFKCVRLWNWGSWEQGHLSNTPQVSVIIPAFNAEKYLERTLESVVDQTFRDFEVWVVNDGSTDRTEEVAKDFESRDKRVQLLTISNSGVANARNTGLAVARGKLVAFLDADDLWHPSKLEKQVARLEDCRNNSQIAGCYSLFRRIREDDTVFQSGSSYGPSGCIFGSHLVLNYVGNGSSLLVHKSVAKQVGGFDPSYAKKGIGGCEDWDFQLRILEDHGLVSVPEFLVGYREYSGNMSSNYQAMALGRIEMVQRFINVKQLPKSLQKLALQSTHHFAFSQFRLAKDRKRSWDSFLDLLKLAPIDLLKGTIGSTGRRIRGRANRFLRVFGLGTERPIVSGKPFLDLSPTDGLVRIDQLPNRKLIEKLIQLDRQLLEQSV